MVHIRSFIRAYAKYTGTDKSAKGDGTINHASPAQVWYRIIANLSAGCLVGLSLLALAIVVSEGTFRRQVVQYHNQDNAQYWNDFGKNCLLDPTGFVPGSCGFEQVNTSSVVVWNAIGLNLAKILQVPTGKQFRVSTCWMGATSTIGWASLQFVIGLDYFPECCPKKGAQAIVGMAMVETAARDAFPEGVFLVTTFADKFMNTTQTFRGTDGSSHSLVANISQNIITINGTILPDESGKNTIIYSSPLGKLFQIMSYNIGRIIEISSDVSKSRGWSVGLHSKLPVVTGYLVGHDVANYQLLFLFQLVLSLLSLGLFYGDVYITFKGLGGVLQHKPVLTYDVLSGLERRKFLMSLIILNSIPSILYVDVARIYYGTDNGARIWSISIVSLSILGAFVGFMLVTLVQYIPPIPFLRYKVATFSAPVFLYSSIISVALSIGDEMQTLNLMFNSSPSSLSFFARGRFWPSGDYTADGAPPAITWLAPRMYLEVIFSLLGAVVYSKFKRLVEGNASIVSTEWASSNNFLTACGMPHWITSMPLASYHAIKIGNRRFCKPSTQVMFGYASVVPCASKKVMTEITSAKSGESDIDLISIYDLGWTIAFDRWLTYRPKRFGRNIKNKFHLTQNKEDRRLLKHTLYTHTRGSAID